MADYFEVICTAREIRVQEPREGAVRPIGEILPLVIARYGIGRDAPAAGSEPSGMRMIPQR